MPKTPAVSPRQHIPIVFFVLLAASAACGRQQNPTSATALAVVPSFTAFWQAVSRDPDVIAKVAATTRLPLGAYLTSLATSHKAAINPAAQRLYNQIDAAGYSVARLLHDGGSSGTQLTAADYGQATALLAGPDPSPAGLVPALASVTKLTLYLWHLDSVPAALALEQGQQGTQQEGEQAGQGGRNVSFYPYTETDDVEQPLLRLKPPAPTGCSSVAVSQVPHGPTGYWDTDQAAAFAQRLAHASDQDVAKWLTSVDGWRAGKAPWKHPCDGSD